MQENTAIIIFLLLVGSFLLYIFSSDFKYFINKTLRFLFYENIIVRFIRNKFFQVFIPSLTGAYFLAIGIWLDKWNIFTDHKEQHEKIFIALLILSLAISFMRGLADYIEDKGAMGRAKFMERFTLLTSKLVKSKLVKSKLDRFKVKTLELRPNGDTFKQITQPKDQINIILSEIVSLFYNEFGVRESDLCITIMHQDPSSKKWHFAYETNKDLKHTKPEILMKNSSAASICLENGEPIFYPDKVSSAKKGRYYLSEKDKRGGNGSVFCYPAFTSNKDYEDKYIISFVTYGKVLCSSLDNEQCEAILTIFSDICRRIDLELTLHSIKTWQFDFHSNKTRKVS